MESGVAAEPLGSNHVPAVHRLAPEEAIAEAELASAPVDLPSAAPAGPPPPRRYLDFLDRAMPLLAVSAGGALGAIARYQVGLWMASRAGTVFPWGTLLINVSGSFLLALYLALVTERFAGRATTRLFVATGFCGAYTTFSTFVYEAISLAQHGAIAAAALYVGGSLVLGLLAVALGILVGRAL